MKAYQHSHIFLGAEHHRNEQRTWLVVALTAAMMAVEIVTGVLFGSMALLADGIHMATHAGALSISGFAYLYARRHAADPRYTFGTGKVGDLAGFSSALALALIAVGLGVESIGRVMQPVPIAFDEAIVVAIIGLVVNLVSAWLLLDGGDRHEEHTNGQETSHHHHEDHNLRSAYLHVLADTLTSILAIVALVTGRFFAWNWMDPAMGIVGAIVIARWSVGLMRDTGWVLLDASASEPLRERVRGVISSQGDQVCDLHLWRVGPGRYAAIVSVVTDQPRDVDFYFARLALIPELAHITVEVRHGQLSGG